MIVLVDLNVTDLWLRCLRFYAYEFQYRLCVVSITHSVPVLKASRNCEMSVLWVEGGRYCSCLVCSF